MRRKSTNSTFIKFRLKLHSRDEAKCMPTAGYNKNIFRTMTVLSLKMRWYNLQKLLVKYNGSLILKLLVWMLLEVHYFFSFITFILSLIHSFSLRYKLEKFQSEHKNAVAWEDPFSNRQGVALKCLHLSNKYCDPVYKYRSMRRLGKHNRGQSTALLYNVGQF